MDLQIILLLIPALLIQLGLLVLSLVDLIRRKKVRGGNKWLWGVLIVCVSIIGPVLYLVLGREEE